MKAVLFDAPGIIRVDEVAEPTIEQPGDAIVRVTMSAIGGGDVAAYAGKTTPRRPDGRIGQELVGIVEEVGAGVGRFKAGERVAVPYCISCGGCFYCKQGLQGLCEVIQTYGAELPGAQAEYVRVPSADSMLERLPDALTDTQAIFLAHLLSGPYAGLVDAELQAGESVVVIGSGATGLSTQLVVRTMAAGTLIAVDHHDDRLAVASELGAVPLKLEGEALISTVRSLTGGRGADIVVEAAGSAPALSEAVDLVRVAGRVLSLGTGIQDTANFPIGRLVAKHARFVPGGRPSVKNYMPVLARMIARAVLDPSPLASHTLPLSHAPQAYELLKNRQDRAIKVLLTP